MNENQFKYATVWQRFGAHILDIVILLPFSALSIWGTKYYWFQIAYFVPGLLLGFFYNAYLPFKYGGTPGKLIMKTKIRNMDGSPITLKTALIRFSPLLFLSLLMSVGMIMANLSMTPEEYNAIDGFLNRSLELTKRTPGWFSAVNTALQIWVWSEVVVILFNKKRRAIHDFIAGTVVVQVKNENLPAQEQII